MQSPYAPENEHAIKSANDLFGKWTPLPSKRPLTPRQELTKYFQDRARDKHGEKLTGKRIGVLLSHCTERDLASFKADMEEWAKKYGDDFNWNQTFWGRLKPRD